MIKKIVLGAIMVAPLAMVACSSSHATHKKDEKPAATNNPTSTDNPTSTNNPTKPEPVVPVVMHKHYPIAHQYRMNQDNSLKTKFVEQIDGKYTTVDLVEKPDSILLPSQVLFSSKAKVQTKLSDLLKLLKNNMEVEYTFNENFKVTTDNDKWTFDGDELVKHDDKPANITIEYKGLKTTTKAWYGELDSAVMKNGDLSKLDITKVGTPSVWGTTTSLSKAKAPDGTDALKVHMDDVQESKGGIKAYGYISGINTLPNPIPLTPYANYIAIKVYVTKSMLNTPIWFRSTWIRTNVGGTKTNNLGDFSSAELKFSEAGWYLIQTKINKSLDWSGDFKLSLLKFVQLTSDGAAKSGDLYLENIYESYDKITSTKGPKAKNIYFEL